jgi:hypothetical protein
MPEAESAAAPAAAPASPRVVANTTPIDLAILKDDLGIDPADTSNDAWLQRRVNGVWQRMETYTARSLSSPPSGFVDDWGELVMNDRVQQQPPLWNNMRPRASVFLRQFPVLSINGVELNGTPIDPGFAIVDNKTGKLFGLDGSSLYARDLGVLLPSARAKVTYLAGWAELPSDLYEVLLQAMEVQWNSRLAQESGLGGGNVNEVQVQDVGSFKMSSTNAFTTAANKGTGAIDPMLGPYTAILDNYVDWRASLGLSTFATTTDVDVFVALSNSFTMPPPDNVTIVTAATLGDVSWITTSQPVLVSGFGRMRVNAIDVSSPLHILTLANYGAPGIVPAGTPVPRGTLIVPGV